MQLLRVRNVKLFFTYFNPKNVPPPIALRYLSVSQFNPILPKIKHMYATREKGNLWWSVGHGNLTNHKRVIRSWCARRLRHAFRQALKQRGFDKDGKLLMFDVEGNVTEKKKGLVGTLDIRMNVELLTAKYADIVQQAGLLVDHLRYQQLRPAKKRTKQPSAKGSRTPKVEAT
ncbi:hypothetical protein VTO42DRAFT_4814 [Malbranchea cinnamomea]